MGDPDIRISDVWQSSGPRKAKVRVYEITRAGMIRWTGITIKDTGAAWPINFVRSRTLIERDGKPVDSKGASK